MSRRSGTVCRKASSAVDKARAFFPLRIPRLVLSGVGEAPLIKPKQGRGDYDTSHHTRNFLDCLKSRTKPNCDIETGHRSTSAMLVANIAHKTRALLAWDAKAERFTNNPAANKWLSCEHRPAFKPPG